MKIFCITLKNTSNRTDYILNHSKSHGINIELFYGIHGKSFGIQSSIVNNKTNISITSGHVGCILSHYMLWTTLLYLPYDEILIIEDDAVLCDNFAEQFENYKSSLPLDWQYVFVGHCYLNEESIPISSNIITSNVAPLCTHAYMIKKETIPILLDTVNNTSDHVDIQIQQNSLPNLKHYTFNPPLITQLSIDHTRVGDFRSLTYNWSNNT